VGNQLLHTVEIGVTDVNGEILATRDVKQCGYQVSQDILLGGHFSAPVLQGGGGGVLLGGACFLQTNTIQQLLFRNGSLSTRRSDYQGLFQ
jgi:hypothetical protein